MPNQDNIERFESLLTSCKRDGIENLIDFIRSTDFYTAPASTKYHLCCEGGLLQHSLNVYDCLYSKLYNELWNEKLDSINPESFIITSLLHDICKTNFYVPELRNKKVYSEHGSKIDSGGQYDWQQVTGYTINDTLPYGHGEKSVYMISSFIRLTRDEAMAIRWHMGFTEPKEMWNSFTSAITKYPLVLALHEADVEATYLKE